MWLEKTLRKGCRFKAWLSSLQMITVKISSWTVTPEREALGVSFSATTFPTPRIFAVFVRRYTSIVTQRLCLLQIESYEVYELCGQTLRIKIESDASTLRYVVKFTLHSTYCTFTR